MSDHFADAMSISDE